MTAPAGICRRFAASTRGVAAVEFAIIMPVLLLLLLASFDAARAIAVYMKMRAATFTLAAITNQYNNTNDPIQSADMQAILGATSVVMSPYPSAPIKVVVSQLSISSKGKVTVSWSDTLNGVKRTKGSTVSIPSSFTPPNNSCGSYPCYLILSEVSYTFTPSFGSFVTGPITFSDNLYVTPRSSSCILYTPQTPTSC